MLHVPSLSLYTHHLHIFHIIIATLTLTLTLTHTHTCTHIHTHTLTHTHTHTHTHIHTHTHTHTHSLIGYSSLSRCVVCIRERPDDRSSPLPSPISLSYHPSPPHFYANRRKCEPFILCVHKLNIHKLVGAQTEMHFPPNNVS